MAESDGITDMSNFQKNNDQLTDKKYTCIFFDLDHTLWDYEANSRETLQELYQEYDLGSRGIPDVEEFLTTFKKVNIELWNLYDRGLINSDQIRKERFKKILEPFQAYEPKFSEDISHDYLVLCPQKRKLMPYAMEILNYLTRHYRLTIITNGFEDIQHQKLKSGAVETYFEHVITSQKAGHKKPSREIFEHALLCNGIKRHEALMIGDNLITDVGGARNASIDAVFFNSENIKHQEKLDFEITVLNQLKDML